MSTSGNLESLIEKDNGYLITLKAVESGVSKPSVSKYVREHDMCGQMSCLYSSNEIRILFIRARPPFICMVLSTENTVIFVSLFLPDIMLHISKRKTKKFIMQTQRFLIWGPVKSRQAAVIWLKYMTRKDVFVI